MKSIIKIAITFVFVGFFFLSVQHSAAPVEAVNQEPSREGVEFFEKKIRPVLEAQCYMCHNSKSKKPQGGLVLDTREGMLKGGASGEAAVVPGDPEKSLLIKAIRHTDAKLQMPPGAQLPADQIKDFEAWVKMGAPDPRAGDAPKSTAGWQTDDFNEARKFWSYQPVKDSPPPPVKNKSWAKSPVDQFVLAKLEEKSLKPAAPADKRTLIRRATFDLTGLPPTPDEVEAFLRDKSADAFARVVDRLLTSPHYGERWGRHWLDVVRYADTSGCNSDFPIPSAYRYRNYVIKSFNADKPYDQFVREQIAGDLMTGKTDAEKQERIVATGYLALSRRFGSRNNENHLTIDDTIDNVGRTVLGLSVSCARCHDHKFDPIPAKDYYALYGIFGSTRYAFPGTEIYPHTKDFVALGTPGEAAKLNKWQTELAALDDKLENLNVERAGLERKAKAAKKTTEAAKEGLKETAKEEAVKEKGRGVKEKEEEGKGGKGKGEEEKGDTVPAARTVTVVKAEIAEVKARIDDLEESPPRVEKAYAVSEGKAANARIQRKGEPKNLGDEAPRGFLQILGGQKLLEEAKDGSGRLELAGWLTDKQNPLTARVMVNRIWQRHFGKGLVQTPNDFGVRGKAPTHPELLDYLAARFVESGWSTKAMHRLMMLSRAYQMSSADDAQSASLDVSNDYLWRFNRRRLDAEEIRDAMLAASGALDRRMGGAHPFPAESEWRYTQHKPFIATYESDQRSVYLMQQRIKKHPFLEVFDGADTNATTAERAISTTPIQALFMMNDPLVHKQADNLAVRVGMAYASEPERVDYAYRLAFGRPATPSEIRDGIAYLRQSRRDMKDAQMPVDQQSRAALASYLRVLFSSNEFLFVD